MGVKLLTVLGGGAATAAITAGLAATTVVGPLATAAAGTGLTALERAPLVTVTVTGRGTVQLQAQAAVVTTASTVRLVPVQLLLRRHLQWVMDKDWAQWS